MSLGLSGQGTACKMKPKLKFAVFTRTKQLKSGLISLKLFHASQPVRNGDNLEILLSYLYLIDLDSGVE